MPVAFILCHSSVFEKSQVSWEITCFVNYYEHFPNGYTAQFHAKGAGNTLPKWCADMQKKFSFRPPLTTPKIVVC